MATQLGTLERLASFVGSSFADLSIELTIDNAPFYFQELGVTLPPSLLADPAFVSALARAATHCGTVAQAVADLRGAASGTGSLLDLSDALLKRLAEIAVEVKPLTDLVGGVTPSQMLIDAIVRRFEAQRPTMMSIATLLGIIDRDITLNLPPAGGFPPHTASFANRQLHLERLAQLATQPVSYLQSPTFEWGSSPFNPFLMLQRFGTLVQLLGAPAAVTGSTPADARLRSSPVTITANQGASPPGLDLAFNVAIIDGLDISIPLSQTLSVHVTTQGSLPKGFTFTLTPPSTIHYTPASTPFHAGLVSALTLGPPTGEPSVILLGESLGSRLEASSLSLTLSLQLDAPVGTSSANGGPVVGLSVTNGNAAFDLSRGDGFVTSLVPKASFNAKFALAATWSPAGGLRLEGSGGIEVDIPLHLDIGPIEISALKLAFTPVTDGSFPIEISATIAASLGPASATLDRVGLRGVLTFPGGFGGNLGPANLTLGFKPPTGIGVAIEAGSVRGGGFLSFDETKGRYSGAAELSVFQVTVKAFGLLETRLPDGRKGYSFAIVISAEFTPIQLGFGFTLLGVGGLIGINRSLNDEGLSSAVRSGSLENILFPHNPERDAPAIIHDLATIFPASPGHYVLGPMAKFGWGTPTLIDAEFGIVLELPGPRLSILGVAHMALPTKRAALLAINVAVAGTLDFPKKLFTIAASLYDSNVVGYRISGDMAFRLSFGDQPNFALALGGLNPSYQPPPGFPDLRRLTVDLGINGNPSLTAQGYFALTSNTAQVGAAIDLHASGFGIDLNGHLGFDALFVFSPFSFVASFSAGVSVSFHGVGLGVGLNGSISGPTPWHVSAEACVSILFWDACLPIDFSFGTNTRAELPAMDPWTGNTDLSDASRNVTGLKTAIEDSGNWSGSFPAGMHPVVSLADAATRTGAPIDPVGQATLHQKVLPLNFRLTRFGIYRPTTNTFFRVQEVKVNNTQVALPLPAATDMFAPALFKEMSDAEKLSSEPYQKFDSGFTVSPTNVDARDLLSHDINYVTKVIGDQGDESDGAIPAGLTLRHIAAMATRSATALGGIRGSGTQRFVDPTAPVKVRMADELFVAGDARTAVANRDLTDGLDVAQTSAQNAIDEHVANHPEDRGQFRVVANYLAA